jgi:hypothetical protein
MNRIDQANQANQNELKKRKGNYIHVRTSLARLIISILVRGWCNIFVHVMYIICSITVLYYYTIFYYYLFIVRDDDFKKE